MTSSLSPQHAAADEELVSVYIPTRNRRDLLKRAIDSVLQQTYPNIELIICDDASTDDTPELVSRMADLHPQLVYFRNDTQQGSCHTRNCAIEAAQGHFITGLDDDDEFLPDRIQTFLERWNPKWSCLSSLALHTRADGETHSFSKPTRVVSLDDILYFNYIGNQVFTTTERLRELGGFNPRFPAFQDYDLWTRLIASYGPALRIGVQTQHIHREHEHERLSVGSEVYRAYMLYLEDHGDRMTRQHIVAQRFFLMLNYPQLGKPQISGLLRMVGSPIFREAVGGYLYRRFPSGMHVASQIRRRLRRKSGDEPVPMSIHSVPPPD